jgi:hypothetical protein
MISAHIWPSPLSHFVHQSFVSVFRCSSLSSSTSSTVLCGCKNIWGSKSRSNRIVSLPELRDNATCPVIPSTLATPKRKRISRKDPLTPDLSPTKKLRGCTVARESMACLIKIRSQLFTCPVRLYTILFAFSSLLFTHCPQFLSLACTYRTMWPIFGGLLWLHRTWRRNFKHHTLPIFREYCPVTGYQRHLGGGWLLEVTISLLLSFVKPCWKIFILFQVSITISSRFMGAAELPQTHWTGAMAYHRAGRFHLPDFRAIPTRTSSSCVLL